MTDDYESFDDKYLQRLFREKEISIAEYLSLKNQERIIDKLHKLEMKLDALDIHLKYK